MNRPPCTPRIYLDTKIVSLLVLVIGCLSACQTDTAPSTHPMLPPDFALRFHVLGKPSSDEPLRQRSQYVLEPDRGFHVAVGAGAVIDYYPPLTARISRVEYYDICQHVMRNHLMAEPTSPAVIDGTPGLRYDVLIIAHGRTHRYTTTPPESPPTVQLLRKLTELRAAAFTAP